MAGGETDETGRGEKKWATEEGMKDEGGREPRFEVMWLMEDESFYNTVQRGDRHTYLLQRHSARGEPHSLSLLKEPKIPFIVGKTDPRH